MQDKLHAGQYPCAPVNSWFKVVELPLIRQLKTVTVDGKESSIAEEIFNKTSEHIAWLVN